MSVEPGMERLPPQSRDAERSVIGSILRDNSVLNDVLQYLRSDNFYFDAHQKIFQVITDLADQGHPIDIVILAERLKLLQQVEDIGGYPYLVELWDAAPTAANAEYYAKIVREKSISRNLIHASTEILRDAYEQAQSADELLGQAETKILRIAEQGTTGRTHTLADALKDAYDRIDQRSKRDSLAISGLATGFADLDSITAGLQKSELIIIAARPSVGKTAFSLNVVRHIIVEEKQAVLFVSLEQSRIELAERLLCCQARVDSHKLRKGHLNSEDIQKLIAAGDQLRQAKLFIDDQPSQTMLRIASSARRLKRPDRGNIQLVVIDYLQLIEPEDKRQPRQEQVATISRRLKFLARELNIPVIALAQVNRASEDRQDHRPRLADLRESGCLTGETLIQIVGEDREIPIRELVGRSNFRVWSMDEDTFQVEPALVSHAFSTGIKRVYRMTTERGYTIRATANHPFYTITGWRRLDALQTGDRIAIPSHDSPSAVDRRYIDDEPEMLRQPLTIACDVDWDAIVEIEADGEEEVFDLTVPGPHNFVANGIIVHNSIEQDADTCMMLHRPGKFDGVEDNTIEVIIAKQRNGPTGDVTLAYIKQYMKYENYAADGAFGAG